MNNKYFAYHGPQNNENFDFEGGYGVTAESKWKNIKEGDLVYVLQKIKGKKAFEFCGIFKVIGHYLTDKSENKYCYRFKLEDVSKLQYPIKINEEEFGKKLPQKESNLGWSNFKLHFCEQGGSFRTPLPNDVVKVLDNLLDYRSESEDAYSHRDVKREDADLAIKILCERGEKATVGAILDQIEDIFEKERRSLNSNWRMITERNIRKYWYK